MRSITNFKWDALLLTGFEDFSTADGNVGDNAMTIFMATQRQRSRQHDDNAPATLVATYFANFDVR